ncbi:MAG: SoxR reducing system RseC family protein [Gammaproteobacteria bacterium]
MLEEKAQVVRVENNRTWVKTQRESSCSSCAVNKGCGTSVLSKVIGARQTEIEVLTNDNYKLGDHVVIGIDESALVKGSLAVYLLPLLTLFIGAFVGNWMANIGLTVNSDLSAIVCGAVGFMSGLFWLKRFTRRIQSDKTYQPVILSRTISSF